MTRGLATVVAALLAGGGLAGCGKPVGSEGAACTGGRACDPGLTCASNLCVRLGVGEGEGEGDCQGDEAATAVVDDCNSIPTASCAAADQNAAIATCKDAGLDLRSGLFQAAFDCITQIPSTSCATLTDALNACFAALTSCPNPDAQNLCVQASDTCEQESDPNFPLESCSNDLTPTNTAFRQAYANCFNASTEACSNVHESCYNIAVNALSGAP